MTREEIEKAIKNGESVWLVFEDRIYKLDKSGIIDINDCCVEYYNNYHRCNLYATTSDFYETEARAKHFISHCGVTCTATLPFLTWEEFNKDTLGFDFTDNIGNKYRCHIVRDYRGGEDFIVLYDKNGTISVDEEWEATEQNFYKAYDECVRLFRGE